MKREVIIKLISAMIIFALLSSITILPIFGAESTVTEEKIISSISSDAVFAEDSIIVILSQTASLQFVEYTVESFSEISFKSISSLTSAIDKMAMNAITTGVDAISKGGEPTIADNLDLEGYRTMLCLELTNPGKENVIKAVKALQTRNDVYCVCPNYYMNFIEPASENVETHAYSSSLEYNDQDEMYELLGLDAIWDMLKSDQLSYGYGEDTPLVAVIDSGITHNSFTNRIIDHMSGDFTDLTQILDSDDVLPSGSIGIPEDDKGHGTHVAGIIKSVVEYNDYQNIEFASLKVTDNSGDPYDTSVIAVISAINYAQGLNIPLINISGMTQIGPTGLDLSATFRTAISGYQGLIICSAGNDNMYLETEDEDDDMADNDYYPASLIMDNVITVGSCDLYGEKSDFSNWGRYNVDLFAPGEEIFSTFSTVKCNEGTCELGDYANSHVNIDMNGDGELDVGYHVLSGTSMAAPLVTGVAAMILAFNPNLSADIVKDIILSTVDEYESLEDLCTTGGRLNVYEAIMEATNYCSHNSFSYASVGSDMHTKRCGICRHISYEGHDLYIYSISGDDCNVKCSLCTYEITCNEQPEYYGTNANGHFVDCTCGCYSFFEEHSYTISYDTNGLGYHYLTCTDCGYVGLEAHDWVYSSSKYRCLICGMTSTVRPPSVVEGVIPEVDEIVASLPPVNDEKDLTK